MKNVFTALSLGGWGEDGAGVASIKSYNNMFGVDVSRHVPDLDKNGKQQFDDHGKMRMKQVKRQYGSLEEGCGSPGKTPLKAT